TGRCEVIETPGAWAGIVKRLGAPVAENAATLGPGDVMILFTDGITEAMDARGEQLDISRLCRAVEEVGDRPVEEIRDHVMAAVRAWSTVQTDDRTLVVVRHVGRP